MSYVGSGHRFKVGVAAFGFPVSEIFTFGITDANFNLLLDREFNPNLAPYDLTRGGIPFLFSDKRRGRQVSLSVQDAYTYKGLTLTTGLRYEHYKFVLKRRHVSPRLGLAYYFNQTRTVVRFSYNRLFQAPPNEHFCSRPPHKRHT